MEFLAGQLNALPPGAALVALVWLLLRRAKGVNAATRYVIWWLVLVVAIAIPLIPRRTVLAPKAEIAQAVQQRPPVVATLSAPPEEKWGDWEERATLVLVMAGVVMLARLLLSFVGVWWMKRRAHFHRQEATGWRRVRVLESERVKSPVACGYLRPAVVLPVGWRQQVEADDLQRVMRHELAHLARFDDFGLLAQRAVQAVFWWNPLVWFVARQLDLERGIACDDWAIARSREGVRPYASTLTRMVEQRMSMLAPGAASRLSLRIERLLEAGRDAAPKVARGRLGLAAVVIAGLFVMAVSFPALFAFEYEGPPPAGAEAPRSSGFLAGLVKAGYGSLSIDEIIELKNHGVDGAFITNATEALGQKLNAQDLIRLRQHQPDWGLARALREAAIPFDWEALVEASDRGVKAHHVREARKYKSKLALREITRLKESGVI
jgi:beta-lactamase regulating signal transducer with metallopeptidase domain